MKDKAAIVGSGVIGGGWAARFLLFGWDVAVFDPDPDAECRTLEVLENARRSLPGLFDHALPAEGKLTFVGAVSRAVDGAAWIQESLPERLLLKQEIYREIQASCNESAIIGSSTSGFTPTQLQQAAARPSQIVVSHPYNPVYLLPVVELVGSVANPEPIIKRTVDIHESIGMKPLVLRSEIEAHIGDRLLESAWRESLWLIKEKIATTEKIDDVIRFGFGLRWAQMGIFETYRIGGGEAGMQHFLAQFGPTLKFPWSRLTDVPDLDERLTSRIASQSDAQSGHYTIRELERRRDDNLTAILRALKRQDAGAGQFYRRLDRKLASSETVLRSEPVLTADRVIPTSWTDYNGHMNEVYYLEVFSKATDRFLEMANVGPAYAEEGFGYFTVDTRIRYLREVLEGQGVKVRTQCLASTGKKLHLFHTMRSANGIELATGEHLLLHVDLSLRRTTAIERERGRRLQLIADSHAGLPRPKHATM